MTEPLIMWLNVAAIYLEKATGFILRGTFVIGHHFITMHPTAVAVCQCGPKSWTNRLIGNTIPTARK